MSLSLEEALRASLDHAPARVTYLARRGVPVRFATLAVETPDESPSTAIAVRRMRDALAPFVGRDLAREAAAQLAFILTLDPQTDPLDEAHTIVAARQRGRAIGLPPWPANIDADLAAHALAAAWRAA